MQPVTERRVPEAPGQRADDLEANDLQSATARVFISTTALNWMTRYPSAKARPGGRTIQRSRACGSDRSRGHVSSASLRGLVDVPHGAAQTSRRA